MDREELIERICLTDATYECGQVGFSGNCEKCEEVLNALLDEYDKQIKADAIDEFTDALINPNNYESYDFDECLSDSNKANDFYKYVFAMAEQLKGAEE